MNNIPKIDIEKIIADTDAPFYLFILQTEDGGVFTWTNEGFRQFTEDFQDTSVFTKKAAEKAYWDAYKDARDDSPMFSGNARLDVAPIKIYQP